LEQKGEAYTSLTTNTDDLSPTCPSPDSPESTISPAASAWEKKSGITHHDARWGDISGWKVGPAQRFCTRSGVGQVGTGAGWRVPAPSTGQPPPTSHGKLLLGGLPSRTGQIFP
jgi:hypothetical protein